MISQYRIGDHNVVKIDGKLMGGPETTEFRDVTYKLHKEGAKKVILDLSNVHWINSAGIGALVASYITFERDKNHIKLASPSSKVEEVLKITRLYDILDIYDSVEAANTN